MWGLWLGAATLEHKQWLTDQKLIYKVTVLPKSSWLGKGRLRSNLALGKEDVESSNGLCEIAHLCGGADVTKTWLISI